VGAFVTDTSPSDVESSPGAAVVDAVGANVPLEPTTSVEDDAVEDPVVEGTSTSAAVIDAVGANVPLEPITSVEDDAVEDPVVEGTNVLNITAGAKELPSEATALVGAKVSPVESVAAGDAELLLPLPPEPASDDDDDDDVVVEANVGNGDDPALAAGADVPPGVMLPSASDGLSEVPPSPTTSGNVPAKDGALVLVLLLPPPVIVGTAVVAVLPSIVGTVPVITDGVSVTIVKTEGDGAFVVIFSEPVFHVGTCVEKSMVE
jgi:hypothetical protein